MTAEAIAKALGGRKAGAAWMARCPAHDDRAPSLAIADAKRRQGARALPCRLRSARRDRRASRARRLARYRPGRSPILAQGRSSTTGRTRLRRPEANRGGARHLARFAPGRGNAGRNLSPLARTRDPGAAFDPLPCRAEASFGRRLAGDGGAGDAGRRRQSDRHSPHLPRPRRQREGAGRAGEDDARSVPRRRGAARPARGRADGRRRHRDLPCRHAGQRDKRHGRRSRPRAFAASTCRPSCAT